MNFSFIYGNWEISYKLRKWNENDGPFHEDYAEIYKITTEVEFDCCGDRFIQEHDLTADLEFFPAVMDELTEKANKDLKEKTK